jgi:hypothetical protein
MADRPAASQTGPLAAEREYLDRVKRLAVGLLGHASLVYGDELKEAQEVQAQIADIVTEAYAIESGLARADKMSARGDGRASLAVDAARIYANDAADRVAAASRQVTAALTARGVDGTVAPASQRLAAYPGIDVIAARRRLADAVIQAGRYIF